MAIPPAQILSEQVQPAINAAFQREIPCDYNPDHNYLEFKPDYNTDYKVSLKIQGDVEMYTVEASRPLESFNELLRLVAEANLHLSWCKVFYRDNRLYLSVSSLYPAGASITNVIKTILTRFRDEFNLIYDKIENRAGFG